MNIKERILNYLSSKGISVTRAEVVLGWSKGALLKANSISSDRIGEFLLLFDDLSAEWLLRGEGEMLKCGTQSVLTSSQSGDVSVYYNMYKEKDVEVGVLREEIGVLKQKLAQLSAITSLKKKDEKSDTKSA